MSDQDPISDALSPGVLSIAVISPDDQRRKAALTELSECHSGPIREFTATYPALSEVSRVIGHNFDIVFVDLDSDLEYALELVETICSRDLAIAMVYSAHADPALLVRCMRAGARELLGLPFSCGEMAEAMVRASALLSTVRPPRKTAGKLLVFLGAKGGSGVTTVACNFAVSLAQDHKQRTLLIDLNLPLGDVAINLGINAEHSIVSAFQNSSRLDSHFLSTLLARHDSGLNVLAAPSELAPTYVSVEAIDRLLEVARQEFDYVVVDAGSRLDLQRKHLFDESATIYLVTQAGIPELRNSHRLISQLGAAGSPKLEIVLNRCDSRRLEIDEEHIAKALKRPAKWRIPNNYAAVRGMQNSATPLSEDGGQISRVIREMTRSVCGQPAVAEKKKGFSLFKLGMLF
ncbi:MAG: AAA family ATPase [Terracidiphilus sp.]|jgi:pilus assembly protein CpaE